MIRAPVPKTSPLRSFPTSRPSSKIERVLISGRAQRPEQVHEAVDDHVQALAGLALAADDRPGLEGAVAHDRGHLEELGVVQSLEQRRLLQHRRGHGDPLEGVRSLEVAVHGPWTAGPQPGLRRTSALLKPP